MKLPAALWLTLLAQALWVMAAATSVAAASSGRFVPRDPHFVVANITQTMPDESLRELLEQWRASPQAEGPAVALATAFVQRARTRREPRYFGRAEALLAPRALRPGAGAELRRLYAETLQFRHAFAPAAVLLDTLLQEQPHDSSIRLQRASLRLTRGDFTGARADCAQLTRARRLAPAGFACLAEALAGSGELARGRVLLAAMGTDSPSLDPALRAYLLATRAELSERAGEIAAAIAFYREAMQLAPQDDATRAALADALFEHGDADATQPLAVDNPSLALLVRRAAFAGADRQVLLDRARAWLELEQARGDAIHHREAALLALADHDSAAALAAARRNFETQRELADVRVLARAAMLAGDAQAQDMLRQWLRSTGYQDAITEKILANGPRS